MSDVDLLVHPGDRDRAREVLEGAGYRFRPEPQAPLKPFDTEFTGEMAFRRDREVTIELHWELTASEWLRRLIALDAETLWKAAIPLDLDGAQVLQLAPADALLHVCLHLASHNYAHRAGYRDIAQLLNHRQPFAWEAFLARARRFRLRVASYFALEAAASELGAAVPTQVLEALRPPAWQRRLIHWVADPHRGLKGELRYTIHRSYVAQLAIADRPLDILPVVVWLLFPGPRWLAERYRLAGWWKLLLAVFRHPFFVLWQGLLALREVVLKRQQPSSLCRARKE